MKLISLLSDTTRARASAAALVLLVAVLSIGLLPLDGAEAATTVPLATAESFALLAGSTITNTGETVVSGDIGLHPGTAVTGFGPGADAVTQEGSLHVADGVALDAKNDLTTAYTNAAGQTPVTRVATELGQSTLTPGVYDSASGTFGVTGPLTLDAEGDPDAVFIFQTTTTLVTASASSVNVINGADLCNVFWQVGSSATLGSASTFLGTVMADQSITLNNGATVQGRLLAREGAVTMDSNVITNDACTTAVVDDGGGTDDTTDDTTDDVTDDTTDETTPDDGADDATDGGTDDTTSDGPTDGSEVDTTTGADGDADESTSVQDDTADDADAPVVTSETGTPTDADTTGQVREVPGGAVAAGGGGLDTGSSGPSLLIAGGLLLLAAATGAGTVAQRRARAQGA